MLLLAPIALASACSSGWLLASDSPPHSVRSADAKTRSRIPPSCRWSEVPSPDPVRPRQYNSLRAVSVVSDRDVWAVGSSFAGGEGGTERWYPLHWNGAKWDVMRPPPGSGAIYDISALSPRNVWAVGDHVLHWDGKGWTRLRVADPGTRFWFFEGVAAISRNDVFAVGTTAPAPGGSLVEHWDGTSWTIVASPTDPGIPFGEFEAVTGRQGDVWAVGERAPHAYNPLTEHWDGTRFHVVPSPSVTAARKPFDWLFSVAMSSPTDVWAVGSSGEHGAFGGGGDHALIEHWNGHAWSVSPSPVVHATGFRLSSVAASRSGEAFAVGSAGSGRRTRALLERWNGRWWRRTGNPATDGSSLSGVAANPGGGFWAVGSTPADGRQRSLVLRCAPS
jgi:hypothetical protein